MWLWTAIRDSTALKTSPRWTHTVTVHDLWNAPRGNADTLLPATDIIHHVDHVPDPNGSIRGISSPSHQQWEVGTYYNTKRLSNLSKLSNWEGHGLNPAFQLQKHIKTKRGPHTV